MYKTPPYKTIQEETNELRGNFTNLAGLYNFPGTQEILEKISQIQKIYEEKTGKQGREADKLRLDQISFIQQVTDDLLKQDLKSNKEEIRLQAERTLLGVVIHRYLRLIVCYQPRLKASFKGTLTFFASMVAYKPVSSCELHNTLFELFRFANLDPYTILLCSKALQSYLRLEKSKDRYAYINKNPDFFEELDDIIKEAITNTTVPDKVPIEMQHAYISYVESMGVALNTTDKEVIKFIEDLSIRIKKGLKHYRRRDI